MNSSVEKRAIVIRPLAIRNILLDVEQPLKPNKVGILLDDNIRYQADIDDWLHLIWVFVDGNVETFSRPVLDKQKYGGVGGGIAWSNCSRLDPGALDYFIEYLDD